MKFNSKQALRLVLLSGAAVLSTGVVHAQETTGEVVVKGRRPLAESEAAALQVQKKSDSLVSVLSADAIGDLPDQNIAYAIGRLPGVGVERDQGQSRYVNLRGMPRKWTTISFDGLSVVSPEGRDSRFDNIPSAIASQVTIQKAIVPSMAADTVAGNVDIRTRRAFDYKGQKITGKIGLGHVELGGGLETDLSLVYSNIFMDGKLGIVAQGSYYSREMATDNWETDPYLTNTTDPTKHFAREHENKHYRLTRYNGSASLRADYKLDENNTIFASTIYTQYHDDELRDNFILRLDQGTNAAGVSYTNTANITASSPTVGTVYGARLNARVDYRDTVEQMSTSTAGGEHHWGEWGASWRLNYTYTEDGRDAPVALAFQSSSTFSARPTVDYDFSNGDVNTVKLYTTGGTTSARIKGAQVTNIESFAFPIQTLTQLKGGDITSAYTAKFDLDRDTSLFGGTKFEFGGLYTTRTKKSRETSYTATAAQLTAATITLPTWATFATDTPYLGSQNLNYTFRYTHQGFTTNYVNNLVAKGIATRNDTTSNYWKVKEEIAAAYAMATTDLGWGNVVYGARVEKIKNSGQAYLTQLAGVPLAKTSSDVTEVYPSAHLNWNATDNVKVRVGLTTSASRPDFDDLRPNFTYSDANQTVSGGNPDAKPEKQKGLDAYVEWYMTPEGFFSAGLFYKDIQDVLYDKSEVFGRSLLNSGTTDRSGYVLTTKRNGGDGHLQGAEIFYSHTAQGLVAKTGLPEWMGGFGLRGSATFTESEVLVPAVNGVPARKVSLPGSSDAVYNFQLIYEKYGISARLAYQYRTEWLQEIGAYQTIGTGIYPVDNGDIYWDSDEEIDASVRYQVNKHFEIYLDGINLGNQGARRYADQKRYPIEYEKFGRRFVAGARFNF